MKRILFVDDAPNILSGLERMLFDVEEWDMTFVDSGQAALDTMASAPFDVIVSDMRMPGMDGAILLARVQEQYPSTVRIVLSGHTELEATLRAVPVAHQFLSKPCESAVLREVVTRACGLQAFLDDRALQEALGSIKSLPALPQVYNELVVALADPEVSIDELSAIVIQDSGITARILQLVNSSFFGVARSISDIRQATTHLGVDMLRDLIPSVEIFRDFESGGRPAGFSLEKEQAHATLSARIARRLLSDKTMGEDAFMAAMLHDLGKLVLATMLPEAYERVVTAADGGKPLHVVEEEINGVSHAEIGAYLLGIWGLPYPIVEAVANHHHPSRVPRESFDVLGAVHVANSLAHELAASVGGSTQTSPAQLDLDYLESMAMVNELPGWREMAAEEFGAGVEEAA